MLISLKYLNFLFACSCGIIVANLWYATPILTDISSSLSVSIKDVAIIATITQFGYLLGLLFLVPLLDILENKKLIIFIMVLNSIFLFLIGVSKSFTNFLILSFFIGFFSSNVQMIVPFGASMSPAQKRGASIGVIVSGLLFGIMLARPLSSFLAEIIGWHGIFVISGILILFLSILFWFVVPFKVPKDKINYGKLIYSMFILFKTTLILRQRGYYHLLAFAVFCLFWVAAPLTLIKTFNFNNHQVALFALIGIAGAIAAPIAGKIADKGKTKWATKVALLSISFSILLAAFPIENRYLAFSWLAICGIILDFGVSLNLVVSQQIIYSISDEMRTRLNSIFMVMFFAGGSIGSYLGGFTYAHFNAIGAFLIGSIIGFMSFLLFIWDMKKLR